MTRGYKSLLTALLAPALILGVVAMNPTVLNAQRRGGPGQTADAGPFGPLRWRNIGPERGGRSHRGRGQHRAA